MTAEEKREIKEIWVAIISINILLAITFVGLVLLVLWLASKGVL